MTVLILVALLWEYRDSQVLLIAIGVQVGKNLKTFFGLVVDEPSGRLREQEDEKFDDSCGGILDTEGITSHWYEGIGPKEKQPRCAELAWNGVESNEFDTDGSTKWCDTVGTKHILP